MRRLVLAADRPQLDYATANQRDALAQPLRIGPDRYAHYLVRIAKIVRFTLTAPGCGMGDYLREDVRAKLLQIPGVTDVDAQVVFDPPWNQAMMSDAARLQLGLM